MPNGEWLLKSQRKQVWEAIQGAGYNPSAFTWDDSDELAEKETEILSYGENYFAIDVSLSGFFACRFSPGEQQLTEHATFSDWPSVIEDFSLWLSYIEREAETPDLWAMLSEEANLVAAPKGEDDNSPFSKEEQNRIAANIEQIKSHLAMMGSFTVQQLTGINDRLDQMQEASERLGRKDWKNYALGVITTVILSNGLNGDTAKEVFRISVQVLKWVFHVIPLLS